MPTCGCWCGSSLGEFQLPCYIVSAGLAGIYLAAQLSVLFRGMRIDCGCFGAISESTIGVSTIVRTSVLLLSCAWLTWFEAGRSGIRRSFSAPRSMTRSAMTLVELLVVIGMIGILVAIVLPAVQAARESGRRMSCMNNQRQLVLAAQLHESTYKRFPSTGWGFNGSVCTIKVPGKSSQGVGFSLCYRTSNSPTLVCIPYSSTSSFGKTSFNSTCFGNFQY